MPELPEVETVRRGLVPIMVGRVLSKVTLNRANLRIPFPETMHDLQGNTCQAIGRRGKYLWFIFDHNQTLIVHLGMSGSFAINPDNSSLHDHVVFETEQDRIIYNDPRRFGMMFTLPSGQEHLHPPFCRMGVEPLGNHFHAAELYAVLQNKKSPIKTALLDQSVVAGIGNIYACEALYRAGISPLSAANSLSMARVERLVVAIREILHAAIASGGSSLRDHRQTDGTMGYFQHHFDVYDKEGEKCPMTGGTIKRIVQSGRSTFYCPAKQR